MDEVKAPWLDASAVGQAAYCPYQLYLARHGAARDAASLEALERGTAAHARWNVGQRRRRGSRTLVVVLRVALALVLLAAAALLAAAVLGVPGSS